MSSTFCFSGCCNTVFCSPYLSVGYWLYRYLFYFRLIYRLRSLSFSVFMLRRSLRLVFIDVPWICFISRICCGGWFSLDPFFVCTLALSLCSFLHSLVTSSLLGPNILLSTLFSNTLSLPSFLNVSDQVLHPYKKKRQNYISICLNP